MKVKYTIEGNAVQMGGYHGEVEIDDAEVKDMSVFAMENLITEVVQDEINNVVQWGWIIDYDNA